MTSWRRWFLRQYRTWIQGWVVCPTCDAFMPPYNLPIHSDYHFQQEQTWLRNELSKETGGNIG